MLVPDHSPRELFGPEPRSAWHPDVAFVWLTMLVFFPLVGPLAALAAPLAYAKFAWDDFHVAEWVLRRDPYHARGVACFWFCLSRGALKSVVAATPLAIIANPPWGWHRPVDWWVPTALFAGVVVHVALAVKGWRAATRHQVRVWIDPGLNAARKRRRWPPRCDSARNDAGNFGLIAAVLVVLFILGLDALASALTGYELPAAAMLVAAVIGPLLLTRRVLAVAPGECWSADGTAEEPDAGDTVTTACAS